jgi:hypothetical protein
MIFENISVQRLEQLLLPHMDRPAWPGMDDPAVKIRASEYAKKSGLWDKIGETLDVSSTIEVLRHSEYFDFRRGGRSRHDSAIKQRIAQTDRAALALWLDHPAGKLEYLEDLLWAWCESDWHIASHEGLHIELVSSAVARMLAEYRHLFRDRLDVSTCKRISLEIEQRILDVALDWRKNDRWNTTENNWNTVCNANLVQTAFYEIQDARNLAAFIHPLCRRMDYALAYFTPDGGCCEGANYWEYGFGHFLHLALALQRRTGGAVDLTDDPHVQRICRFPLATCLRGQQRATFSDSGNGYLGASTALLVNHFLPLPELFKLVEPRAGGLLNLGDIRSLCLDKGQRFDPLADHRDYFLPDMGYTKLNADGDVVLAVLAGSNDVSHNHNDIGSFMFLHGDRVLLTDPGSPEYNNKTFGPKRYEMLVCRSRGHSVPIINGQEQGTGPQYRGIIQVKGLNEPAGKTIDVDMGRAYADPTLRQMTRQFHLDRTGELRIIDLFEFTEPPRSLEEAFVTFEPVKINETGCAVYIGSEGQAIAMRSDIEGRFAVESFTPEEHEGQDQRVLYRVSFMPDRLSTSMRVKFLCSLL